MGAPGRIRVLVVSPSLSEGGAERFTSWLLTHLDRSAFELGLCLFRDRVTYPLPSDVTVEVLGKRRPWHLWRTMKRLARLQERMRPDVILSVMGAVNWVTGMALRRSPVRAGWVARIASNPVLADGPVEKFLTKRYCPAADSFISISNGLVAGFAGCYPFAQGRIGYIPNPVDFDSIDRLAAEAPAVQADVKVPTVISVGRLSAEKRPDLLLDAFALVRRRLAANLWIVGDGPLRRLVKVWIQRRGLQDCVRLLGFQDNPFALMRQAKLFVLTSDHEGLCNSLIEAQGLGLPAVSTCCPYGPEEIILPGQSGILVPVGEAGAVAEGIAGLLSDPRHLQDVGDIAREHARQLFNLTGIMRQWENTLRSAARREGTCAE